MIKTMRERSVKLQKKWMAVTLLDEFEQTDLCGGCLHIITDDGNYLKKDVEFCLQNAIDNNCLWAETIARLFMDFTEEELKQVIEEPWDIRLEMFPI